MVVLFVPNITVTWSREALECRRVKKFFGTGFGGSFSKETVSHQCFPGHLGLFVQNVWKSVCSLCDFVIIICWSLAVSNYDYYWDRVLLEIVTQILALEFCNQRNFFLVISHCIKIPPFLFSKLIDDAENKETPHYKLTLLLEQELPEASRRETIDELADRFCVNHGSKKKTRERLYKTLFLVPRTRLDLLPYYSRFAAILDRVYSDSTLVAELEQQMHGQARFKKNANLESRLRTARYLGELTKFRVAPPIIVLRGIRRCLADFSGYNIDVACCLLESCGRYLYRMKHTHSRLGGLMDTMMRIKKAKVRDILFFFLHLSFSIQ